MIQVTKTLSIQNHVDTISNFVNAGGQFLVLSREERKFRLFRNTLTAGIKDIKIRCSWIGHAENEKVMEEISGYIDNSQDIFLIIEEKRLKDFEVLKEIRSCYGKEALPVLILTQEIGEAQINFLLEMGASNILVVPYSPVNLIEKISFTLKPGKIGQIIDNGRALILKKKYEDALAVCDIILKHKPGSAAALILKGDVYSARALDNPEEADSDRQLAKSCYLQAWNGSKKYLEPLKRLVDACEKESTPEEYLDYIKELDKLSPLSIERKMKIGKMLAEIKGDMKEAAIYFEGAISLLKKDVETTPEQIKELKERIHFILKVKAPTLASKYN